MYIYNTKPIPLPSSLARAGNKLKRRREREREEREVGNEKEKPDRMSRKKPGLRLKLSDHSNFV